ncbi:fumarylacetoacetate hydrolase family protein [Streptomyces sp. NPDC008139]|uniref:fumarylacetoacetate hydrolase family protein n=1 Tax=Streptomyces sp. NPDC008139 TaxID=3364814 RepID=UPI0036EBFEB9
MRVTYHLRAKGTDSFKPCGPWIVTTDAIPDPDRLGITLATGEDVRIECRTERLIYSVAEVIAHVSDHHTLFPDRHARERDPHGLTRHHLAPVRPRSDYGQPGSV